MRRFHLGPILLVAALSAQAPQPAGAQTPRDGEVRQLVTFTFLPGRSTDAIALFRDEAVPLYRRDDAMLSFRGFREVESPVPLDLVAVSAFRGMGGMDRSNEALRALATEAGTGIGEVYGRIAALSSGHTDEFVEMIPELGSGDPSAAPLTAFIRYRVAAGEGGLFETAIENSIAPWEARSGVPSATGRFLLSDGWHYLRILGFDSLGAYQEYWSGIRELQNYGVVTSVTTARRDVLLSSLRELRVR